MTLDRTAWRAGVMRFFIKLPSLSYLHLYIGSSHCDSPFPMVAKELTV